MSNYSETILAHDYNESMGRHIYLPQSDFILAKSLRESYSQNNISNIVEIGCGPGRITSLIAQELLRYRKDFKLTGLDIDFDFIKYANKNNTLVENIFFVCEDLVTSERVREAQVLFSQGGNHHFEGQDLLTFRNSKAEAYFISDEFLPEYENEQQRKIKCLIWYSTVIYKAWQQLQKFNLAGDELEIRIHNILVDAEIQTLLADLHQVILRFVMTINLKIGLSFNFNRF